MQKSIFLNMQECTLSLRSCLSEKYYRGFFGCFPLCVMLLLCDIAAAQQFQGGQHFQGTHSVWIDGASGITADTPHTQLWRRIGVSPKFLGYELGLANFYSTTWEIKGEKLFLTEFRAVQSSEPIDASPDIVGGAELPIFAAWYTGDLHVAFGERQPIDPNRRPTLIYDYYFDSIYIASVDKGVVVSSVQLENARLPTPIAVQLVRRMLTRPQQSAADRSKNRDR